MKKALSIAFSVLVLMALGQGLCRSQEIPDGPVMSVDSSNFEKPAFLAPPLIFHNPVFKIKDPFSPITREQAAAAKDREVSAILVESIRKDLKRTITPLPAGFYPVLLMSRLLFGAPFSIPFGYIPMGNASNPFNIALIPGKAPVENPYGQEAFPQLVELEYDSESGVYVQKMVDWDTYEQRLKNVRPRFNTSAVPMVPVNSVERRVFGY